MAGFCSIKGAAQYDFMELATQWQATSAHASVHDWYDGHRGDEKMTDLNVTQELELFHCGDTNWQMNKSVGKQLQICASPRKIEDSDVGASILLDVGEIG